MASPRTATFFFDISDDDDLSQPCNKQHLDICGVLIHADFDGTEIGFTGSLDGVTYYAVTWEGTAVAFTVAAGDACMFNAAILSGLPYVKMTSNANEDGDVTCPPIYRDFN